MAKSKDINDPAGVTEYIQKLDNPEATIIKALREIILSTDKEIGEQIKWNAPCFFFTGVMKPFDAKEYKRDIIVMNIRKGNILLVLPTGAKVANTSGLLEGDYKDGRRLITFKDLGDLKLKEKRLQKVIKDWLKLVER